MTITSDVQYVENDALPADWSVVTLRNAALFQVGYPFSSSKFSEDGSGIRLIRNADLKSSVTVIGYSGQYSSEFVVNNGDLLIGMDGDFIACMWNEGQALLNQRVGRLFCGDRLDCLYAYYALPKYLKEIEYRTSATTVKHLSHGGVLDIEMILPEIAEQRAIAEALADIDALIECQNRLIAKKRNVLKGTAQALLAGGRRLPGFNDDWRRMKVDELVEVDPENLSAGTESTLLFNYVSLEDVSGGRLNSWSEMMFRSAPSRARRVVREGDVLFGTVRPNLQSHCMVPRITGNWVASTGFAVLRAKDGVDSRFVFHQLFTADVSGQIDLALTGSNYPAISNREVRRLAISVPSSKEQHAIAEVLTDMDVEIEALETRLAKTRDLKIGMAQELLSGRTRLV